jgi:hypothetical protein
MSFRSILLTFAKSFWYLSNYGTLQTYSVEFKFWDLIPFQKKSAFAK